MRFRVEGLAAQGVPFCPLFGEPAPLNVNIIKPTNPSQKGYPEFKMVTGTTKVIPSGMPAVPMPMHMPVQGATDDGGSGMFRV